MHSPMKNVLQHKINAKTKEVAFYDIRPGNGEGLFSQKKIRDEIHKEKVKKRISGEPHDINKQTIYIASNSNSNQGRIMQGQYFPKQI